MSPSSVKINRSVYGTHYNGTAVEEFRTKRMKIELHTLSSLYHVNACMSQPPGKQHIYQNETTRIDIA